MAVSEADKRLVWVRAGGHCVLCRDRVLDESIAPVFVADVAHAAGQGDGAGTPRPAPAMPAEERDRPDNLLLLCQRCHRKVDNKTVEQVYDIPTLYALKREHEHLVRYLLSLMESSRTLVLRVIGDVRGVPVSASRLEIAAAVAARGRVPAYLDDRVHAEAEIDLRGVDEDDTEYWDVQRRKLEREVPKAVAAIRSGMADHMTVFAFARLPLLVLLGWLLEDTIRMDIAQRSRGPAAWRPVTGPPQHFQADVVRGRGDVPEALLVLPLSGTPDLRALPDGLAELTRSTVTPVGSAPDVAVADTVGTQTLFDRELRRALGQLESVLIEPSTLHVVAATPLSLAVATGRAIDPQVFPTVHVYDLNGREYRPVITLEHKDRP